MVKVIYGYQDGELNFHHMLDDMPADNLSPKFTQMHAHENYEIYYFVSGDCSYIVEGHEYAIYPGCLMIMRPAEVHSLKVSGNRDYERFALNFNENMFELFDPDHLLLEPYHKRSLGEMNLYEPGEFKTDISKFLFRASGSGGNSRELREQKLAIMCNLLPLLFEIREVFLKRATADYTSEANNRLEILNYINGSICTDLSLDKLAERFFLSKTQLVRVFRNLTGTTVGEYVTAKRLLLARELIQTGSTATNACRECGFSDYSAFYRAYRKKFNVSPKWELPSAGKSAVVNKNSKNKMNVSEGL